MEGSIWKAREANLLLLRDVAILIAIPLDHEILHFDLLDHQQLAQLGRRRVKGLQLLRVGFFRQLLRRCEQASLGNHLNILALAFFAFLAFFGPIGS